ncbi:hypothetical protein ACQR0Z_33000 [Bradyrhizobium sp. HKCCYLS3077]|uniref:hypothetical protein n=1 Tax=Bradyrhizobium sp. HKCCYLS3077 TaxID=3420761 RepID=UPI003EBB05E9
MLQASLVDSNKLDLKLRSARSASRMVSATVYQAGGSFATQAFDTGIDDAATPAKQKHGRR